MADATLVVKILTDTKDAVSGADEASARFGKMGAGIKKAAVPAAAAAVAIGAFALSAVKAASRTEQAMGGVEAVFGKNAKTVERWASQAASSIGLAKSQYGELATLIGSQLKNAGFSMDQVTAKTGDLISMGADLAAMYGGTTADAVSALSGALKGEFDPLEKYGTGITAAKIQAELAAKGLDKLTGKAAEQAKAAATLALIQKQTADAHGAAAREANTAAAKTQQLSAQVENMKSNIGTALLPVMAAFLGILSKIAEWMGKNTTAVTVIVAILGVLAVAILAANAAMWIMAANPIVLWVVGITAAIALLVIGLIILYKKSETVRAVLDAVFTAIKAAAIFVANAIGAAFSKLWAGIVNAAQWMGRMISAVVASIRTVIGWISSALSAVSSAISTVVSRVQEMLRWFGRITFPGAVKGAIDAIASAIRNVISAVGDLIGWLGRIHVPKISLPNPFSLPVPAAGVPTGAVAGAGAPPVPMVRSSGASSAGTVIVQVSGALDPDAVARQIGRILDGHDRRQGTRGSRGLRTV